MEKAVLTIGLSGLELMVANPKNGCKGKWRDVARTVEVEGDCQRGSVYSRELHKWKTREGRFPHPREGRYLVTTHSDAEALTCSEESFCT